jgi:hypothetical protein
MTSHAAKESVAMPEPTLTRAASGDYPILHLTLGGPLDLRLLGLNVQLDQFALDITATPDAGLLGALLSALLGGLATVLKGSAFGRLAQRRDH